MTQPTIDTPDYQRGVASAQVLLAQTPVATTVIDVGLPPNTETLVVVAEETATTPVFANAIGYTSGIEYPGIRVQQTFPQRLWVTWFFDVTSVIDNVVDVQVLNPAGASWYVYADSGVHITADGSRLASQTGASYVIPIVPGIAAGDHPPVELQYVCNSSFASGANLLAAPGAGQRYRIYDLTIAARTAGNFIEALDTVTSATILAGDCATAGYQLNSNFRPTGYPMGDNGALEMAIGAGNGTAHVLYTTETI